MTTSALNKFLSVFSLASIATTILVNPAFASPIIHHGDKGTYTIDVEAGTYRGCLNSGGCISLGRKYLIKSNNTESTDISWKNGEYIYEISEGRINVSQNGRLIFQDRISVDFSKVSQVNLSHPSKAQKTNKITTCSTFSVCTQAIRNNPQDPYAYLSRAEFYKSHSEKEKALADCDKAIEVSPQNADAYFTRAKFRGDFNWSNRSETVSDYDRAIEINPQNSDIYLQRGTFKFFFKANENWNDEESQEILNDFNQVIKINPRSSDAYLFRGGLERRQNKTEEALNDCRLARKYASTSSNKEASEMCIRQLESGQQ